jgi:hypothetical protein
MIDGVVVLPDIELQEPRVRPNEAECPEHGGVGALALPASVAIEDLMSFEDRFGRAYDRVVDYPVPERGRMDGAALGVVNHERAVGAEGIALVYELRANEIQVPIEIGAEGKHGWIEGLPLAGLMKGQGEVFPVGDFFQSDERPMHPS